MSHGVVRYLGLCPYEPTWRAMQDFVNNRTPETLDELWVLEHPPVFTQGQAGKAEHILEPDSIPIVHSDRGGQVTYHGPGQLVLYSLLDIKRQGITLKRLVCALEDALIALLGELNLVGTKRPGAPGIYVNEAKIAFIGLRIRRGCSYHGISLNVNLDVEPFSRINPCGYENLAITQLADFLPEITTTEIAPKLISHIAQTLGYTFDKATEGHCSR